VMKHPLARGSGWPQASRGAPPQRKLTERLCNRKKGEAKSILVDAPEFRSEAEEAKWWDRHQDLIADLLIKHGRRGAVPTKNVSVRLPVTDIERARKLAGKRGVGYQTLIKTLLHEALKKESKIA